MANVPDLAGILGLKPPSPAPAKRLDDYPTNFAQLPGPNPEAVAEKCRRRLSYFVQRAWAALHPGDLLEWSDHHDALCDHVQWVLEEWMRKKVAEREGRHYRQAAKQLAISLPPSTLKTELFMVFAPAWMWIRWPSWRVLCVSCNPRVSLDSADKSRGVIRSAWYQGTFKPTWQIKDEQDAKSSFANTAGGARESQGIVATVVGQHADAIFVDDPTDPKKVTRAALLDAQREWPSLRNRVTDERSTIRVILQQRLDVDDLIGFVTRGKKARDWIRVILPLELVLKKRCETPMPVDAKNRLALDRGTAIGTWRDWRGAEGERLQPARFPDEVVEEMKLSYGPYGWSSQCQQDPIPKDGGRIKRAWLSMCRLENLIAGDRPRPDLVGLDPKTNEPLEPYVVPLKGDWWDFDFTYLSIDPAAKKTADGSLWGSVVVSGKGARRFVLEDKSQRGEITDLLPVWREMISRWRPQKVIVEETAAGPEVIRTLREELASGKIRGSDGRPVICELRVITPGEVGGDKVARLAGVLNQFSAGLIYLLDGCDWLEEYVNELTMFPNYPTADRVDATTALLAIARVEDTLWPEIRVRRAAEEAARARAAMSPEERAALPPVPEPPSMAEKMHSILFGAPVNRAPVIDLETGKPPTECMHYWVGGRCTRCGA